jgi:TIR domain
MATEPYKPRVFISYAHADEPEKPADGEVQWLKFVQDHLKPAQRKGAFDLWIDGLMKGGENWESKIKQQLDACDIFLLLVSRHSTSSGYVVDKEIALIRERQAKGEDVHFYPLVLTYTSEAGLDLVRDKNLRPRDGNPLSSYAPHDRDRHMAAIANEIAAIAKGIADRKRASPAEPAPTPELEPQPEPTPPVEPAPTRPTLEPAQPDPRPLPPPPPDPPPRPVETPRIRNRETLEAWLKGQSWEVAVIIASRAALRSPLPNPNWKDLRLEDTATAIFRAVAVAWLIGRYPAYAEELHDEAADAGQAFELRDTAVSSAALAACNPGFEDAARACVRGAGDERPLWDEIRADSAIVEASGATAVAEARLWAKGEPIWANRARRTWQNILLREDRHNWDVWIDWYEARLRGGSRSEDEELVFVSVPPAIRGISGGFMTDVYTINAWIKDRLPYAAKG